MDAFPEATLLDAFEFEHDGRRFSCRIEAATGGRTDAWWWFGVSSDDRHRYAPFRASDDDTQQSIQARVLTYYHELMARRAEPVASQWRRGLRPTPTGATPTISTITSDVPVESEPSATA